MGKRFYRFIVSLFMLMAVWVAMFAITSCSSGKAVVREVPIVTERITHDTLVISKFIHTRDSIVVRDSIAPNAYGGLDRWHSEFRSNKSSSGDTVKITVHDTIPQPFPVTEQVIVEKEKEKELSWRQMLGWIGAGIIVGSFAAIFAIAMVKK